jgi:uncharacterized protein (TIGR02145 family)
MYMQDATTDMCNDTPFFDNTSSDTIANTTFDLIDKRDGNVYSVRRLGNSSFNRCIMVSNLKLAGWTTITSNDSDITGNPYTLPASSTSGFDSDAGQYMYNGDSTTGAYYNWLTATANTGAGLTTDGAQASGSICPKRWRLPTGEPTTGEFTQLYTAYGSNKTNFNNAWSPVYAGRYGNNTFYDSGTAAYWWSSASASSTSARLLRETTSGGAYPADINPQRYGLSVRCLLGNHLQ